MTKNEKAKKYYSDNKEKIKERSKANLVLKISLMSEEELKVYKEKIKQANSLKYQKNKEKILQQKKNYREKNKDAINEKVRLKRKESAEKPNDYLKRKYNLTPEQYLTMLKNQNGVCAICGKQEKNRRLAVDHCHKTGKIRGLLCALCNTAIGKFNDDVNLLTKAIKYLKK